MTRVKNSLILSFLFIFGLVFLSFVALAQENIQENSEEILEAKVVGILEEKFIIPEYGESDQLYQKLKLIVTKGTLKDKEIIVESGNVPSVNIPKYKRDDQVIVAYSKDFEGNDAFYINDFIRRAPIAYLFIILIAFVVLIAGWRGLLSLLGMGISFVVIFTLVLPKILQGVNPVGIAILGSLIIIPVTFLLSHGFNKKTLVAIAGTLFALIITGILANIFVEYAKLTGFASEEAGFLQANKQGSVNIKGLLLAGIIIGVLGVLDDITVSQSAIVFQLKKANQKMKFVELYKSAMNVGRDHISSMVNTLILVYTGAALPLLLLFIDNPHPFGEVINYEIVADEIIRMLVGSIGLILAVPLTTLLACLVVEKTGGERK